MSNPACAEDLLRNAGIMRRQVGNVIKMDQGHKTRPGNC